MHDGPEERASTQAASAPAPIGGPGAPPPAARLVFGERLDVASRYADLLATEGVVRGLIGPREAPRIWDRHLLNCAVISDLIPSGSYVVDVGSGAGLPGIVLAVTRPDLSVVLMEPLARRAMFLAEAVEILGLANASVVRARAEESRIQPADVVTARAVAPLDRLTGWCLPLTAPGGRLLAFKGSSAEQEVEEHRTAVRRLGGGEPRIHRCGSGVIDPPTTIVEVVRERDTAVGRGTSKRRREQ